ncbi:hypothetical protein BKA65DRAFT_261752 [Rhexocercosporidium sp. MPI-PUGE-AT-0058]|nr:hypothetical protein BKA65DRAFT_261752 [Rhexocercosporidium sp. MPI-PUGE-AT-0058]
MGSDRAKPAYCEDVDDTSGREVRASRRSAAVKPKVSYQDDRERERERDREKRRSTKHRKSQSDAIYAPELSPGQHVEIMTPRDERRKSSSSSNKSPRKVNRPPSAHENRSFSKSAIPSNSRVDPSHFGIAPAAVSQPIPLPIRPRTLTAPTYPRPQSFHAPQTPSGNNGPPPSMSAYYPQQPIITPSYPPPSPGSSYMNYAAPQYNTPRQSAPPPQLQYTSSYQYSAPQQYSTPPQYTMSAQPQYHMPQPQAQAQTDYFAPKATSRPLAARFGDIPPRSQTAFEPAGRTSSAFGHRDARSPRVYSDYDTAYYDDGYTSAADGATIRKAERRESIREPASTLTMSKAEVDTRAMPPPPHRRQGILRRNSVYNTDPISDPGVGVEYYERDTRSEYRDEPRPRRPSTNRHSASYDLGSVRIEAANSGRRRQSSYEQPSSAGVSDGYEAKMQQASQYQGASYEAKINQATSYQDDVAGGPSVPLTAEVLRRQQRKQGGSSRSTKSSASRDESDYKKSATTRTTRSGSGDNDENVTLKVTGQTRVMVGGMQIDCADGGEISIQRQKSLRNGSERSNSEYGGGRIEDRQSRVSRPSGRSRMSSHSGESWTRTPQYPRDGNYI